MYYFQLLVVVASFCSVLAIPVPLTITNAKPADVYLDANSSETRGTLGYNVSCDADCRCRIDPLGTRTTRKSVTCDKKNTDNSTKCKVTLYLQNSERSCSSWSVSETSVPDKVASPDTQAAAVNFTVPGLADWSAQCEVGVASPCVCRVVTPSNTVECADKSIIGRNICNVNILEQSPGTYTCMSESSESGQGGVTLIRSNNSVPIGNPNSVPEKPTNIQVPLNTVVQVPGTEVSVACNPMSLGEDLCDCKINSNVPDQNQPCSDRSKWSDLQTCHVGVKWHDSNKTYSCFSTPIIDFPMVVPDDLTKSSIVTDPSNGKTYELSCKKFAPEKSNDLTCLVNGKSCLNVVDGTNIFAVRVSGHPDAPTCTRLTQQQFSLYVPTGEWLLT
jgi:hypothetical protein